MSAPNPSFTTRFTSCPTCLTLIEIGAAHDCPGIQPEVGSVEEFLLLWTKRLPDHVKKLQVKRWTERDLPDGFSLTVKWPKK